MSEAFVLQAGDVTGTSRSLPIRSLARGLALAMIFTIPWEVGVTLGSVGRISRALGLAVAAVWILSVLLAGVRRPGPVQKAYVAFVLWSGATYFWSVDPTASLLQAVTYVQLLGMVLLLWDLFDTERAVRAALQAYVYGSFVTAGSVIVQFLTSPPARFAEHARYIGLGTEIDGIGLIVAAAAPAAWYLAMGPGLGEGSRWRRWVDLAYIPTAFFALILTGTRGAALASIPTVVLMIWSLRRLDPVMRRTGAAALGVTFVLVLLFAPPEMLARVGSVWSALTGSETTAQWNVEDVGGRAETWGGAFAAFSERPIQGVGTDAIRATIAVQKKAHNIYLSVLAETGLIGFVLFGRLLWRVVVIVRRYAPGWERAYWWAQLALFGIAGMSLSLETSKSVWLFITLSVAAAPLARLDIRRTEPPVPSTSGVAGSRDAG